MSKIEKLSKTLRRVTRKEWGLTRRTTLMLYRGLFVPDMGYASLLWADSTRLPKERQLLLRAQRSALYALCYGVIVGDVSNCRTTTLGFLGQTLGSNDEITQRC